MFPAMQTKENDKKLGDYGSRNFVLPLLSLLQIYTKYVKDNANL